MGLPEINAFFDGGLQEDAVSITENSFTKPDELRMNSVVSCIDENLRDALREALHQVVDCGHSEGFDLDVQADRDLLVRSVQVAGILALVEFAKDANSILDAVE